MQRPLLAVSPRVISRVVYTRVINLITKPTSRDIRDVVNIMPVRCCSLGSKAYTNVMNSIKSDEIIIAVTKKKC